jgi:hypothetical protein
MCSQPTANTPSPMTPPQAAAAVTLSSSLSHPAPCYRRHLHSSQPDRMNRPPRAARDPAPGALPSHPVHPPGRRPETRPAQSTGRCRALYPTPYRPSRALMPRPRAARQRAQPPEVLHDPSPSHARPPCLDALRTRRAPAAEQPSRALTPPCPDPCVEPNRPQTRPSHDRAPASSIHSALMDLYCFCFSSPLIPPSIDAS